MFNKKPPKLPKDELMHKLHEIDAEDDYTEEMDMDSAIDDLIYYAEDLSLEQIDLLMDALKEARANKE